MNQQANVVGRRGANLPGSRIVDIHALDLGDDLPILLTDLYVRLAKNHEEVARTGLFEQFIPHHYVGIHLGGQRLTYGLKHF